MSMFATKQDYLEHIKQQLVVLDNGEGVLSVFLPDAAQYDDTETAPDLHLANAALGGNGGVEVAFTEWATNNLTGDVRDMIFAEMVDRLLR